MNKISFRLDWSVIVLIFLILTLGLSFLRNVTRINRINRDIKETSSELEKSKAEGEKLQAKLSQVQNELYIESQIRDKLGYAKEGEIVLILPPDEILEKLAMEVTEEEETLPDPNWRKWMKLFF